MEENRNGKAQKKRKRASAYVVKVHFGTARLEHCIRNLLKTVESKAEQDMEFL